MKKFSLMAITAITVVSLQACNQAAKDSKGAADSVNAVKDTTTTGATGIAVTKDDAKFATDAANGGMAEVAMGKLASEKAVNPQVKEFAAMMVTDHTKANDELMTIAKTKNITLPTAPDADHQKMMADISKKSGADFDKAYVDAMIDGHKKTVSLLEDGSKNCKDADLKAFADKTLPTVKAHLAKIQGIHDSMK